MIVAGLQMDIAWENPPENFRRVRQMAEDIWKARGHSGRRGRWERWPRGEDGNRVGTSRPHRAP